jgi:hypothetical protein
MILHALYENGGLAPSDIESHIKDDIEKEGIKLVDMDKKMGQAYKDIVSHPPSAFPPETGSVRPPLKSPFFILLPSRPSLFDGEHHPRTTQSHYPRHQRQPQLD